MSGQVVCSICNNLFLRVVVAFIVIINSASIIIIINVIFLIVIVIIINVSIIIINIIIVLLLLLLLLLLIIIIIIIIAARLAELDKRQCAEWEVAGSNPIWTNTQGLKINEENVLPLLSHLQMVRLLVFPDKDEKP